MHKNTPLLHKLATPLQLIVAVLAFSFPPLYASAKELELEKDELKFGFIKLTDMAPLAIAYEKGDKRPLPDCNVFFRYNATYPYYSDAIWYLTQMRRWGQNTEHKNDNWHHETAKKVYRPDIYLQAARLLVEDGKAKKSEFPWDTDGYRPPQTHFIDNVVYDGHQPNAYLNKFPIGLKNKEIVKGTEVKVVKH